MTSQLFEKYATGEFLIREANGYISRGIIIWDGSGFANDTVVEGGTVFSLETPGSVTVQAKSGNTGNGTVSPVAANPTSTQTGTYVVTMTGATTFGVVAPDGSILSGGSSAAPYLDGIGFKYTAGGTPNVAGDTYSIAIAIGAAPVVTAGGSNAGNGTIGSIEAVQNAPAQTGNYVVAMTGATTFSVNAPNGTRLQDGATGVPYEDEIAFTITAGGTAFVAGDGFTFGVGTGTGNATYYTGAQPAAGIIYNTFLVPAGTSPKFTTIIHHAEVASSALRFLSSVTSASKATAIAQLAALRIFAR